MATTEPLGGTDKAPTSVSALPPALDHLAGVIERSRALLTLPDDGDDAGNPGYAEDTWHRAIDLLSQVAIRLLETLAVVVEGADVFPGSRGSIDFELRISDRRLLVSVPADPNVSIRYYGREATGGDSLNGLLKPGKPAKPLVAWLGA